MDEDKTCSDDCCEEEIRPTQLGGTLLSGLSNARPMTECDEEIEATERGPEPDGINVGNRPSGNNRINDLVIKQMDLGYLVKVGCQTLCIESKERLTKLFTAYVNNPEKTMDKYYRDELLNDGKTVITIGIIGSSHEDVNNYVQYSSFLPYQTFHKKNNKYVGEINGEIYELISITIPAHCTALKFNKFVETHSARDNKQFGKIIELCNGAKR
jgi:hypothetical protein